MGKKIDRTGQVVGLLTVLRENGRSKDGRVLWLCKCRCGNEVTVRSGDLKRKHTTSCGCYHRERTTECNIKHGIRVKHRRLYNSVLNHFKWICTLDCYKTWKIDPRYQNNIYGVVLFCSDLLTLYPKECDRYENDRTLQLDKDSNSNMVFCPENCRFVTRRENQNNRRNTLKLPDGTPLATFCYSIGVETFKDGKPTNEYHRISHAWRRDHSFHPELMSALRKDTRKQARLLYQAAMLRQEFEARVNELKEKVAKLKGHYQTKQFQS